MQTNGGFKEIYFFYFLTIKPTKIPAKVISTKLAMNQLNARLREIGI